ncbi:hypothetical protein FM042_02475 [Aliidiomarina halalkaliphila]|uniref:Outer membrane protein beta-barrel domain-containing protein n=1 Tax=Aliidiomarina halalkaliphila TaxID=2593535 RepID=A0A552X3Y4_9GAMM|nr:hypothetical protein [Aliidiomarina halalkaliphila]TRW49742.1 hypothetical protein FM042_02475 [Aliidiomarina halalkaliphila]
MKMKSIKSVLMCAAATGALAFGTVGTASASPWNYVGGGYYDFGDSGFYLEGSTHVADRFVLNAEIGDTFDTIFRVGGVYLTEAALGGAPLFIAAGYSDYSVDDGIYFGAGVTYAFDPRFDGKFELLHDTAVDGFFRFRSGLTYKLDNNLAVTGSYSLNNRSVSNEFRVGVQYRF